MPFRRGDCDNCELSVKIWGVLFFWPVLGEYGGICLNMAGVDMLPYMMGYWGCTGSDITNDVTDTL